MTDGGPYAPKGDKKASEKRMFDHKVLTIFEHVLE